MKNNAIKIKEENMESVDVPAITVAIIIMGLIITGIGFFNRRILVG